MPKKIFFILIFFIFGLPIQAAASGNVSGYIWSENIGWISLSGVNYGVTINSNGNFSGYAWSENIGWIDFAPAGPYPASPNYSACLDLPGSGQACNGISDYNVGGWARALSYGGGWDGWIKLRGTDYGVSISKTTKKFSGYAWSDMVIGWIKFSGTGYGATTTLAFNSPPNKPTIPSQYPDGETWSNCSFAGKSVPTFYWTYSDPDGDPQAAYEIEVDDNSSFNGAKFNRLVNLAAISYTLDLSQDDPVADWISTLDWNTTYFWHVRVKDNQGNWSEWLTPNQFKTPKHAYGYPDFSWLPASPTQGEVVVFDPDASSVYGGTEISSYLWTITQGTGAFTDSTNNASQYPHIKFSTLNNQIKLEITDTDDYSCESGVADVTAQLPLPEYKEVAPTSWLKRILAFFTFSLKSATLGLAD
ncbi:MAG: hypothetical protein HYT20_02325 [Candidatus Nealsonbacteria bacterium]|nr:hypothetical protein [Candidatus Nealsonbacteria bacterium]